MTLKLSLAPLFQFFRRVWHRSIFYRFTLRAGPVPQNLTAIPTDPWPGDIHAGRLLLDGKFVISDQVISMTDLWIPRDANLTVLADLHRFNWLRDLRALGDNSARRLARQLIINWIDRNQDWRHYSWQVGITGHRVANWIALYDFFCASADESFRTMFFREIMRQVRHLSYSWQDAPRSLERLYALKGLIYAAIALPGESNRLSALLLQLEKEIKAQILADGSHESRCPHTHLIVLRDLIDFRAMLHLIRQEIPPFLQATINKMAPIVRLLRHGDGGLATFGGITCISPLVIDMALSLADVRGRPPEKAEILGVERCTTKSSLVLLNVGAKMSGIQPPSSEIGTGLLNFEWSIGRDRLVLQGDLILHTREEIPFQAADLNDQQSIQIDRVTQKGHILLDATYKSSDETPFCHRRQLYLGEPHLNLRGEDTIQTSCEAAYGIRFILNQNVTTSLTAGKRGVMIQLPAKGKTSKEGQQWRLLVSGAEEILCETYPANQAILLLGRTQANTPISIQWAFCQD